MSASTEQSASKKQRVSTEQSETDAASPTTPQARTPDRPRPRIAAPPQPHEGGWLAKEARVLVGGREMRGRSG